jgi:[protein-PII] uridylyltransferase
MPARPLPPHELVRGLRSELAALRATARAAYAIHGKPSRLTHGLAHVTDGVIQRLWSASDAPGSMALIAVGGYGRGRLYPHSDVDVLVLMPDALADPSAAERFVSRLWDIGVEAGHSVRTLGECLELAATDLTIETALLEARFLAGDRALADRLAGELNRQRNVHDFVLAKIDEQQRRHARFQDVAYNLEPNIKESPGGLRDSHTVIWLARALGLAAEPYGLAVQGLITRAEAQELTRSIRVLSDLRIRLHYLAGRREDRLVFDHQNEIARQLNLAGRRVGRRELRPSELLMRRYYLAAKSVWRYNALLLAEMSQRVATRAERRVRRIDEEFQAVGDSLELIDEATFERRPAAMLDAFLTLQAHPEVAGFGASILRALQRNLSRIDKHFRADPQNRARFLRVFTLPRVTFTLRRMSRYGVLGRYLPVYGRIVGQMQHDLFHVYTVDEHTLMVVRNLRRLALPRFAHEFPFCSALAQDFEGIHLLYIAALFHDIAKGRGGDHSDLGALDAQRFCRQHKVPRADGALIAWLVQEHLSMSATAQKQDLSDPEVIAAFAARVKTERALSALYLFTVADIRGTSPHVWNAWKAKLLEDLFARTRALLRGEGHFNDTWLAAKQEEALGMIAPYVPDVTVVEPFWATLDRSFFQRFEAAEIGWATRSLWSRVEHERPLVRARLSPVGEGIQVLLYAPDKPGLFARITSYFERLGLSIASAKVYTTRNGHALDTLQLLGKTLSLAGHKELLPMIEAELPNLMQSDAPLPPPVTGRSSRLVKHFPIATQVEIRPLKASGRHQVSVSASDRPGLLSRLSRVFWEQGINLHDARIATLGARAEDTFEVEGPLDLPERRERLTQGIAAALG